MLLYPRLVDLYCVGMSFIKCTANIVAYLTTNKEPKRRSTLTHPKYILCAATKLQACFNLHVFIIEQRTCRYLILL